MPYQQINVRDYKFNVGRRWVFYFAYFDRFDVHSKNDEFLILRNGEFWGNHRAIGPGKHCRINPTQNPGKTPPLTLEAVGRGTHFFPVHLRNMSGAQLSGLEPGF
jgi:hypothetical protein